MVIPTSLVGLTRKMNPLDEEVDNTEVHEWKWKLEESE